MLIGIEFVVPDYEDYDDYCEPLETAYITANSQAEAIVKFHAQYPTASLRAVFIRE
jgi:hypothetical protein